MLDNSINIFENFVEYGTNTKLYFDANYQWVPAGALWTFATLNSLRIIAYIPQIIKAARDTNGASAISFTTWGLFFISHLTTVIYAFICLGDALMSLLFVGNAFACLAIITTTAFKRRAQRLLTSIMPETPEKPKPATH